jgi:putative transposase
VHWFETIDDAKAIIEIWRRDYNESRPHVALNDEAPQVYARNLGTLNAEN